MSEHYKRRDCLKTQITITYYGLYNITGKGESQENDCLELNVKHNKDYRPNEQSEKKTQFKSWSFSNLIDCCLWADSSFCSSYLNVCILCWRVDP